MDLHSENIKGIQDECQSSETSNKQIEEDVDLFVEKVAIPVFQGFLSKQNKKHLSGFVSIIDANLRGKLKNIVNECMEELYEEEGIERVCLQQVEDSYDNVIDVSHRSNLVDQNKCSVELSEVGILASDNLEVILEVPDKADEIEYQAHDVMENNFENRSSDCLKQEITEQKLQTSEYLKGITQSESNSSDCPIQGISNYRKTIHGNQNEQLIVSDEDQSKCQIESLIMDVKCENNVIGWSAEETNTSKNTEDPLEFEKVDRIECEVERSCSNEGNNDGKVAEISKLRKKKSGKENFHASEYIDSFIGETYVETKNKKSLVQGKKISEGIVSEYLSRKFPVVMLERSAVAEKMLLAYNFHELEHLGGLPSVIDANLRGKLKDIVNECMEDLYEEARNERNCLQQVEDPCNNVIDVSDRSNLVDQNKCSVELSEVGILASDNLEVILEVPDMADEIDYQAHDVMENNFENGSSDCIKQEISDQKLQTSEYLKAITQSESNSSDCPIQGISNYRKTIHGNQNEELIVSDEDQSKCQIESLIMDVKCENNVIYWSAEETTEEKTNTSKNIEDALGFEKVDRIECEVERSCSNEGNNDCKVAEISKLRKKKSGKETFRQSEYIDSFIGETYIETENKKSLVQGKKISEEGIVSAYFSRKFPVVMLERSAIAEKMLLVNNPHELGMIDTFICEKCSICFGTENVLKTHIHEVHGMNMFVCDKCNKTFKSNKILKSHMWIHTGDYKFVCYVCNKTFLWKSSLRKHCLTHAKKAKDKIDGEEEIIQGYEKLKCPCCSVLFRTQNMLDKHVKVVHDGCNFECKACGKFFSTKQYLNQHMQVHTGMEELKCPICFKCFVTKPVLKRHIINVHCGLKNFSCDECEKSFKSRGSLNEHKQVHGGIKKFVCEICNKCYISKSKLKEHLSAHVIKFEGNKNQFKCRKCDKQFSSKSYLSQHLEAHAGMDKCRCPCCDKLFATESVVKRHIKTVHYGVRNFTCNECGKAFQTSWSLRSHHHWKRDKKFKCKTCGVNSSTKDFIQHLETHAENIVLQEARCLKPENLSKTWTVKSVKQLATTVQVIPPINIDMLVDEWKTLQCEEIPRDWYITETEDSVVHKRIDYYYSKVFALKDVLGTDKYPELIKLVKSVLIIPHIADIERRFSQTSNFLTDSRIRLSEASIGALQTIKDGLKGFDNCCYKVPITQKLINKGVMAHKSYMRRLEEEKRMKAEQKRKMEEKKESEKKKREELEKQKKVIEKKSHQAKESPLKEKSLEKKECETTQDMKVYKSLVDEATERIKNSLKNCDMKGIQIGQTMLEAASKKMDEVQSNLQEIRSEQKEIEKNKRTMLDYFCKSAKKTEKNSYVL